MQFALTDLKNKQSKNKFFFLNIYYKYIKSFIPIKRAICNNNSTHMEECCSFYFISSWTKLHREYKKSCIISMRISWLVCLIYAQSSLYKLWMFFWMVTRRLRTGRGRPQRRVPPATSSWLQVSVPRVETRRRKDLAGANKMIPPMRSRIKTLNEELRPYHETKKWP